MPTHREKYEASQGGYISQPSVTFEYSKSKYKRHIIFQVVALTLTIGFLILYFVGHHNSSPISGPHNNYGQLTEEVRDALCVTDALGGNATTDGRCYYNIVTGVNNNSLIIRYENNLKCTYLLQTRHNCRIRYSFHVHTDQSRDFVNVTNGFFTTKYSGNVGIITGTTKDEFLKIYFQTDGSGIKDDMVLTFNAFRVH